MDHHVHLFDGYTLDPQRRSLVKGEREVALGSRALDLLIALVEHADGVLSRDELVSRVWPTTFVESSSLRVHVAALRRAFQGDPEAHRRIVNVPGRGYSFIGPVLKVPRGAAVPATSVVPRPAAALPQRLPALVGREQTLATLDATLGPRRVITIVGPGGIGKSSVALHLLSRQAGAFGGHVLPVDLSEARAGQLLERVSEALGQPPSDLMPALQHAPLLLLLDNSEHLLEEAASFAEALAIRAPLVHLVCTSREPLHVAEERVIRLGALASDAAIALLVERAKAAADTLAFDDADKPRLAALCELLDGVPLAIELAAVRLESMGLDGLLERPERLLDVLTRGRRHAAPRHRTLRAVMDSSYELLDADERRVFCGLSLFDASFSLTQAVAVVGTPSTEEIVLALVEKSLLISSPDTGHSDDGTCFCWPGMLRRYGLERLAERPDAAQLQQRHRVVNPREFPALAALGVGG